MSQLFVNRLSPVPPSKAVSIDGAVFNGPWLDISHSAYGAAGNGTTDDSGAIALAYAAAVAQGGGVIWLPPTSAGIRVGTTISLAGNAPVWFTGPGKIITTTDVKVFFVTGSQVTFDAVTIDGQQTGVGSNNNLISIESGASDIVIHRCRLLNARLMAVNISGSSNIRVVQNFISQPAIHGVYAIDGSADILVAHNYITAPGFNNANTAAGKGIGVQGNNTLCKDVRIIGNKIVDPNQIGIELFGQSGLSPGVEGATVFGNIIRSSKAANGNRFGISLDATTDATVQSNVVIGTEMAFEVAGGCKRAMYDGNVSKNSLGDGIQVSNNSGLSANDPEDVTIANLIIKGSAGYGMEILKAKSITITNPQVDGATTRGIFLNNVGSNSVVRLHGGIVQNCGQSGVYCFLDGSTSGQTWDISDVTALNNNTSATPGDDVGMAINSESQAHQASVRLGRFTGSVSAAFPIYSRTNALALAPSATASIGLLWRYKAGERWEAVYRLPIQVTGGVAGLTFSCAALPLGVSGRMRLVGTTSGVTAMSTDQTTTLTSAGAVAFLTASFTGFVEITLSVSGGTADGPIDLQVITGAAAAGSIFAGASVELRRV